MNICHRIYFRMTCIGYVFTLQCVTLILNICSKYQCQLESIALKKAKLAGSSSCNRSDYCNAEDGGMSSCHHGEKNTSETLSLPNSEASSGIQKIIPSHFDASFSST